MGNGKVGIFWVLPPLTPGHGTKAPPHILAARTFIDQAPTDGDFLTHDEDHLTHWLRLRRLGPAALAWRGLPLAPTLHRHDDFPNGHVAYDLARDRFTIFAPQFLDRPDLHLFIAPAFDLAIGDYVVRPARHYHQALAG